MADWYGNRTGETYTYRRVRWTDWQEVEDYGNVTSGTVSLSALSDLRATAEFTFEGGDAPNTVDLVRIYYAFTDDYGESETVALGTFFVNMADVTMQAVYAYDADADAMVDTGLQAHGTVECASVLKVPLDAVLGAPQTIPAGTAVVDWVAAKLASMGLRTAQTESSYTLVSNYTFEAGTSWLTVMNTMLGWANFAAMAPDAYGVIQLAKYVPPTKREPVLTFRADDGRSIMHPEVIRSRDLEDTPNVVRLTYQTDEECLYAVASNVDAMSAASLVNRGMRELTLFEEVNELAGGTRADRVDNLIALAQRRLVDNSADIEYVQLRHGFVPIVMGDSVGIVYSDMAWSGTAHEMTITLTPSTQSVLRLRSFTVTQLETATEGGAIWAL